MAVYNKIGGGSNRVILNGKHPTERVNLKNINAIGIYKNNIPEDVNIRFKENGICYGDINKNYYRGNLNGWTQIGSISESYWQPYWFWEINEELYIGFAASFMDFGSRVSYLQIYKVSNGVATELSKTKASTFGASELSESKSNIFYINDTLYFPTSNSGSLKVYKSENFGKTWTNITNQITNTDGSPKSILNDFNAQTITMNNIVYFLKGKLIYSFNGKEIKKAIVLEKDITKNATIIEPSINDRNDCSTRVILTHEQLEHGKYLYRCYDLKENSLMQNEEVISKEYVISSNFFIKEKPFSIIYKRDSEELREFPVKAYIEDREKG